MEILLQQLVNSLSVASVTILIGIGITLIFGLAGIVNFAHGEFLMVGGMITWFLVSSGVNFFVALVGAMVFVGALGFVAERGLFRFTLARPMNGFVMSIGVSVIIRGFAVSLIGGLGNVGGAVVGGLILGLVDGLSAGYGFPEWTDAYSLVVMIVILIVRPQGLLGGTLGPRAS
jgi:branched-subunit amino acid ABC-type transport system permease component